MSAVPTTKLFINGKFVESKTKDWIDVHNPATNEVWKLLTGNLWRKLLRHKKEVPWIDHLHIAEDVLLLLQHISVQSNSSVLTKTGSEFDVIISSSNKHFRLVGLG
jgi:hypothetical protein